MATNKQFYWAVKFLIWLLAALPIAWLSWSILQKTLGPNPAEAIDRFLGYWALVFLWITLAVTPLRLITGLGQLIRFRRLLGLFSFFYAVLHLFSYLTINQFFDWVAIWEDLLKRNYIMFGFFGFIILTILAATSTTTMIKRLGAGNWNRLHKSIYISAILITIHFIMIRKGFQLEPFVYAAVLLLLLTSRFQLKHRRSRKRKFSSLKK